MSAIVVSYHTGDALKACLNALAAEGGVAEVIVVDNGNPKETERWLAGFVTKHPTTRVLFGQGNVGFARGCNLGARGARHPLLLFVNPDLVIAPGAARLMARAASGRRAPCVVGGRLIRRDGSEQRGARREEITPWSAVVGMLGLGRFERVIPAFRSPFRENDSLPPEAAAQAVVSGALMLIPTEDFRRLSGFDEGYFLHAEDIDICRRAREAGGEVIIEPRAEGRHEGATSDVAKFTVQRHKAKSLTRYFRKFARNPWQRLWAEIAAVGMFLALVAPHALSGRKRG